MSLYDLAVDGLEDFYRRRVGSKQLRRREPLIGAVDGSNVIFLTSQSPILPGSQVVYDTYTPLVPMQVVLADTDAGLFQLYNAPVARPVADYTVVPITARQIIYYAWAGFELMEGLWSRGFLLSSNDTTYSPATVESGHIYITVGGLKTGDVVSDPVSGALTFSTSPLQKALLGRCIEMAYLEAMQYEASLSDVNIRERSGGIAVDSSRRTGNINLAIKSCYEYLLKSWYAAMDEYYPDGEHYGGIASQPHSLEYQTFWDWRQTSGGGLVPVWLGWK